MSTRSQPSLFSVIKLSPVEIVVKVLSVMILLSLLNLDESSLSVNTPHSISPDSSRLQDHAVPKFITILGFNVFTINEDFIAAFTLPTPV